MADGDNDNKDVFVALVSQLLLFVLLAGMAGSVDTDLLKASFRKWRGILIGMCCQFGILPVIGLLSTVVFDLPPHFGIALIATTASPGGAYSNWMCSVMNADLALSVAMTTCSTAASIVFMPVNIMGYTYIGYGETPTFSLPKLLLNIAVAILAILTGTVLSAWHPTRRRLFNGIGNFGGLCLIVFSMVFSNSDKPIWEDKDWRFYVSVTSPCAAGLLIAFVLSFSSGMLTRPESVAVTVETCYQNTGLAISICLATFDEEHRASAVAVPLLYGLSQVAFLPTFLAIMWKVGFTYAPTNIGVCRLLYDDFQPTSMTDTQVLRSDTFDSPKASANETPTSDVQFSCYDPNRVWSEASFDESIAEEAKLSIPKTGEFKAISGFAPSAVPITDDHGSPAPNPLGKSSDGDCLRDCLQASLQ